MVLESEFRIGNWYDQFGVYHQVNWVVMKELSRAPKTQLWCKPIPLTPEILEKAGFTQDRNGFLLKNLSFSVTSNGEFLACWQDRQIGKIVKYLHQLQNLYFALTGEELQIDL